MNDRRVDDLVADYLGRVRAAAAVLDPGRREELIEDLREHIASARAELSPETEAGVRTLLERLGDPAAIVAEASAGDPPPPPPVAAPPAIPPPVAPPRSNRALVTVLITVLALFVLAPIIVCILGWAMFQVSSVDEGPQPGPVESYVPVPSSRPS